MSVNDHKFGQILSGVTPIPSLISVLRSQVIFFFFPYLEETIEMPLKPNKSYSNTLS